jgi:putative membrane protein
MRLSSHPLDASDRDRIADAIRDAEARTSAEIIVVVDRAAGAWRSWPLALAFGLALLVPWPLLRLTSWSGDTIHLAQLTLAAGLAVALSRSRVRLAVTPGFLKRRKAHEAAMREFVARGLGQTRGATGVLLYVALAERYAEVVADAAIAARVEDKAWQRPVEDLVGAVAEGRLRDGLLKAIDDLAAILGRHVPPTADDVDELPNRVFLV